MNMIERVARRILDEVPLGYGMSLAEAKAYARAAIEAMREPTVAMLKASPVVGTGINEEGEWAVNTKPAQHVWLAIIDAALNEGDAP